MAAIALAGCAHHRRPPLAAAPMPPPTASPAVRGLDHGLELWWWIVSDPPVKAEDELTADERAAIQGPPAPPPPGLVKRHADKPEPVRFVIKDQRIALETALSPYLDRPLPFPDELRARWRHEGLRTVAVPTADLPSLEASLRTVGP